MGNFSCSSQKNKSLLLLGLDKTGKTSILKELFLQKDGTQHFKEDQTTQVLALKNLLLTIYDVSGDQKMRKFWQNYSQTADIVVFVVDCTDRERIYLAKQELDRILTFKELEDIPLLILLNKQDLKGMTKEELTKTLEIEKITNRPWNITETSIVDKRGLKDCLSYIRNTFIKKNRINK